MSRPARLKRSREESLSVSSPSTFRSCDFQMKAGESSSKIGNLSIATLTKSEKKELMNPERDLWNQVLNIRQLVSRMQANLNRLNSDLAHENSDLNSNFELSKELDSFSIEDSWNSADEESIINLEGILVHVSSSETSSSSPEDKDDASAAASSCVSSLGLGGHETTTPIRISSHQHSKSIARGNLVSPVYSESAAAAAAASTPVAATSKRTLFERQDTESTSSVESLTTMQEFVHFFRIFYYFLLEFPIHFYSFLTDSVHFNNNNNKSRSIRRDGSKKREKQRFFLYTMLVLFIIGCVVWKQCPTTFDSLSRPSQSCVTPTLLPMMNETSRADFSAPLLSVHSPLRSSKIPPRLSSITSPSAKETIELLDSDDQVDASNATEEIVSSLDTQEEVAEGMEVPKMNPLLRHLQNHGKKLVQKMVKNNHKMWNQYPTPRLPQQEEGESTSEQGPLASLQEKGQEVLRKLVQNNHKMWDQYPTPIPKQHHKERRGSSFLRKTANMWSEKSSDYFLSEANRVPLN